MRPELKFFFVMLVIIFVWAIAEKTLEHYEQKRTRNKRIAFRNKFRDTYIDTGTPEQKAMRKDWK